MSPQEAAEAFGEALRRCIYEYQPKPDGDTSALHAVEILRIAAVAAAVIGIPKETFLAGARIGYDQAVEEANKQGIATFKVWKS